MFSAIVALDLFFECTDAVDYDLRPAIEARVLYQARGLFRRTSEEYLSHVAPMGRIVCTVSD